MSEKVVKTTAAKYAKMATSALANADVVIVDGVVKKNRHGMTNITERAWRDQERRAGRGGSFR